MKKLTRRRRRPEAVLSDELCSILETGHDLFRDLGPRLSDEELREKLREPWQRFGARITRDFRRRHPGQRPWGFWTYDAPAPRPIAPPPDGVRWLNEQETALLQELLDTAFLFEHGLIGAKEQEAYDRKNRELIQLYRRANESLQRQESEPVN